MTAIIIVFIVMGLGVLLIISGPTKKVPDQKAIESMEW